MSDHRSEAEKFVSDFLDYIYKYDILDELNKRTNKMERSAGVEGLVKQAERVFPARAADGKKETDKLSAEEVDAAIVAAPNVVDTREMFSRRIQKNGGTRQLLTDVMEGKPGAQEAAQEFLDAENGEKEFDV